ncbi:hypothetical protein NUW54_g14554 [Trametes sanguinea]|uniref:Uncharacterized protein n=1 Tax=Trametes sanguinea TaxID=158606 RepID=A0ACC1MCD3_9APHY|nr:hypothetical protein NUW54_g14554 [Trametes sanguinea]
MSAAGDAQQPTTTAEIGAHCALPSCNLNDFLPIRCKCDKLFCRDHIAPDAHRCPLLVRSDSAQASAAGVAISIGWMVSAISRKGTTSFKLREYCGVVPWRNTQTAPCIGHFAPKTLTSVLRLDVLSNVTHSSPPPQPRRLRWHAFFRFHKPFKRTRVAKINHAVGARARSADRLTAQVQPVHPAHCCRISRIS